MTNKNEFNSMSSFNEYLSKIPKIDLLTYGEPTFKIDKEIKHCLVSNILDEKHNIATRSGLHCAPLVHKHFGTLKSGMTRISISYYNSKHDIMKCIKAIEKIALE